MSSLHLYVFSIPSTESWHDQLSLTPWNVNDLIENGPQRPFTRDINQTSNIGILETLVLCSCSILTPAVPAQFSIEHAPLSYQIFVDLMIYGIARVFILWHCDNARIRHRPWQAINACFPNRYWSLAIPHQHWLVKECQCCAHVLEDCGRGTDTKAESLFMISSLRVIVVFRSVYVN